MKFAEKDEKTTRFMKEKRADTCTRSENNYEEIDCEQFDHSSIYLITSNTEDLQGQWKGVEFTQKKEENEEETFTFKFESSFTVDKLLSIADN